MHAKRAAVVGIFALVCSATAVTSGVPGVGASGASATTTESSHCTRNAPAEPTGPGAPRLGFQPYDPRQGAPPPTTIPSGATPPDRSYDAKAQAAAEEANRRSTSSAPAKPNFPPAGKGSEAPADPCSAPPFHKPAATQEAEIQEAVSGMETLAAAAGCVGNCYQSDRAPMPYNFVEAYNVDYWYWLRGAESNELNACDTGDGPGCFWFVSAQLNTDEPNSAMHSGPQRGVSASGNAGGNWKIDVSGYYNGVFRGGLSSVVSPVATWVRLRTWRVDYVFYGGIYYAQYGVWALWNNQDTYVGSITLPGRWLVWAMPFVEIYETEDQCSTDFVGTYYDEHVFRSSAGGPFRIDRTDAAYEANCANTTWERMNGIGDDFVRDTRDVGRLIRDGARLWDF